MDQYHPSMRRQALLNAATEPAIGRCVENVESTPTQSSMVTGKVFKLLGTVWVVESFYPPSPGVHAPKMKPVAHGGSGSRIVDEDSFSTFFLGPP